MIEIPPEIQIKATISPGPVYYFVEDTFQSDAPHFFIVINNDPQDDKAILLVCPTSQIEKAERRRRSIPNTLVHIKRREYSAFTVDSVIDCNNIIVKNIGHIINQLKHCTLKTKPKMPIQIVKKLRHAVLISPLVTPEIKKMIR